MPPELRCAVAAAVDKSGPPGAPLVDRLRAAAERALASALAADPPGDPLQLLAADALITLACERTASTDPGQLDKVE